MASEPSDERQINLTTIDGLAYLEALTDCAPRLTSRIDMPDALTDWWRGTLHGLIRLAKGRLSEGEHCQACGTSYRTVYWLPDDVWAAITPKPGQLEAGLLCPPCADQRARSAGINLTWKANRG